jgi:hypothetical protein
MLTRTQAFEIIEKERQYQDTNYDPEATINSGLTRRQRDSEVSVGILMLDAYVSSAKTAWVRTKGDNVPAIQEVAKIAAIAVRILERAAGSEKLLDVGLRK